MENTAKIFMWDYQHHFQHSLQYKAENIFNRIDKGLKPKVFLLGLLIDKKNDRNKICLEPEECGYDINSFSNIDKLATELEKVDQERKLFHTHPIAQENHNNRISKKALINSIKKTLDMEDLYGETEKYVSSPTYVEGYLVFTIIELKKDAINEHYSLIKEKIYNRFQISRSFIESTIKTYLKECSDALKDPNQSLQVIERQAEEILRESGKQFMYSISQAGGNIEGLHGLYETCNTIASMKYEGAEGFGKLAIASKDHNNLRLILELEEPIKIRDYRKVRKFLELSSKNSIIISDSALIYGLGEIVGKYNPKDESLFIINFISHFKWEVLHDNKSIMVVEYKSPNIPKEKLDRKKFYSDLPRIFNNIKKRQIDNLWDIIIHATEQKHGTMVVISSDAESEAKRLGKQCFAINPMKLPLNLINQLTSIDGAMLLNQDSICFAIGVILDGLATEKGDSSRGSRFNSAIRYYEQFGKIKPLIIVTISEDGMINFIPNLKPQIKHSEITDRIDKLRELNKIEKIEKKQYYPLINWFETNQFYLLENECKEINSLRKKIEQKEEPSNNRITRDDLKPNKEMNDSFYKN